MRVSTRIAMLVAALCAAGPATAATPRIGAAFEYGAPLRDGDTGRRGMSMHVLFDFEGDASPWSVGGEIAANAESDMGGWGCGTTETGDAVPSLAVDCLQPTLAAHVLAGGSTRAIANTTLLFELGLGPARTWLVPGRGGHTERNLAWSSVIRGAWLLDVGRAFGGAWRVGLQGQGHSLGRKLPAWSGGLRFEAAVYD